MADDAALSAEARKLPKVDRLLAAAEQAGLLGRLGRGPVVAAARDVAGISAVADVDGEGVVEASDAPRPREHRPDAP